MSDEAPRPAARCLYCSKRIKPTKTNKAQSYCNDRCKQAAYRLRRRARSDHTIVETAIADRYKEWERAGFSDDLIQRLMDLWYDHGGVALVKVESMLSMHRLLVVEQLTAERMKDTAELAQLLRDAEQEIARLQENERLRLNEASEKETSRNGT